MDVCSISSFMAWPDVREIVTQIRQSLSPARALAKFSHVSDDAATWPTLESVKAELLERELQARVKAHYKYNGGEQEAAERFRAQMNARMQDAQRKWFRR